MRLFEMSDREFQDWFGRLAVKGFIGLGLLAIFLLGGELLFFGVILPLARLIG